MIRRHCLLALADADGEFVGVYAARVCKVGEVEVAVRGCEVDAVDADSEWGGFCVIRSAHFFLIFSQFFLNFLIS